MPNPPDVIRLHRLHVDAFAVRDADNEMDVKYLRATPLLDNATALRDACRASLLEFEAAHEVMNLLRPVREAAIIGTLRAILRACEES